MKADEGIFLGFLQNSGAYRVMNQRSRRIKETFNLTFDDYYVKRVDTVFPQNLIISSSNEDTEQMLIFDVDFDLIFGFPKREINFKVNIKDNLVHEASKHSNDSIVTDGQ